MKIKLQDKWVGDSEPAYIIAEIGVNHNGDIKIAKKIIDEAKKSGVDAVKFQTFSAENLASKKAKKAKHMEGEESQYEMLRRLELSKKDHKKLFRYAKDKDLAFFSSPAAEENVDILEELRVPFYKIASCHLKNPLLVKYIAEKVRELEKD